MAHSSPHFPDENLSPTEVASLDANVAVAEKTPRNGAVRPVREKPRAEKLFNLSPRTQSLMGVQVVGTGSYLPPVSSYRP